MYWAQVSREAPWWMGGGISLMEEGARTVEAVWWEAFVLCCLKTGKFHGRLKEALCNKA